MLDNDDADTLGLIALFTNGPLGWALLVAAIIVVIIVASNEEDCEKKICDRGKPALIENDCLCLEKAR